MLKKSIVVCCVSLWLLVSGCNSYKEIAPVKGKVTFKEQSLAGMTVILSPVGGRPSMGRTDENGNYEIQYSPKTWGAKVGSCKVSFDPFSHEPTGDPTLCEPSPLIKDVPRKYFKPFMEFQVEPKVNTLDINVE